jgi:hypothetical protein
MRDKFGRAPPIESHRAISHARTYLCLIQYVLAMKGFSYRFLGVTRCLAGVCFFFFVTLKPRVEDTKVHAPYIRARLGTAAPFCEVVVLKLRAVPCIAAHTTGYEVSPATATYIPRDG